MLIEMSVPKYEDNLVIDPFMGSGTTAVASSSLGVGFVGIEIDSGYVEIAQKRLDKGVESEQDSED